MGKKVYSMRQWHGKYGGGWSVVQHQMGKAPIDVVVCRTQEQAQKVIDFHNLMQRELEQEASA